MDNRAQYIRGLRDLANFLEDNEAVPVPSITTVAMIFLSTKQEFATAARAMRSSKKDYIGDYLYLRKSFGPSVALELSIERVQVCRRKVVGRKIIPAMPEHEVDVVEWECDESILDDRERRNYDQIRDGEGSPEVATGSDDLESGVLPITGRDTEGE